MINLVEKARKSAAMETLCRDVPPKHQRGAVYWARFVGALRVHMEWWDGLYQELQAENGRLASALNTALRDLANVQKELAESKARCDKAKVQIKADSFGLEQGQRDALLDCITVG